MFTPSKTVAQLLVAAQPRAPEVLPELTRAAEVVAPHEAIPVAPLPPPAREHGDASLRTLKAPLGDPAALVAGKEIFPLPAVEVYRPDAHSKNAPLAGDEIKLEEVQQAVGEKVERLLGMLSRFHGATNPGMNLGVVKGGHSFTAELAPQVAARLGLVSEDPAAQATLQAIAAELYEWAKTQPQEAGRFGLKVNAGKGDLILVCRAPRPVLKQGSKDRAPRRGGGARPKKR